MNKWSRFNERTKNNQPRLLYSESVELVRAKKPKALDIAAGALNETKDMLGHGFNVTAIDSNPDIERLAKLVGNDNLHVEVSTMEAFNYGKEHYNYITAMFALPFISPEAFDHTFKNIVLSLKKGGIFAFHLFGEEDDWYGTESMTFHTVESARALATGFKLLKFQEINDTDGAVGDEPKHWHIFQLILKK